MIETTGNAGGDDGGAGLAARGRLGLSVMAAGYLALAGWAVWLARHQINPDGVAYIQLARHYAAGRFDLAVASHWGPLLPWLLVPSIWLKLDPVLTAKVLGVLGGLLFALATAVLLRRLNDGRGLALAFAAAALLAVAMAPDPVTPDLLLAGLMAWYFLRSYPLPLGGSPRDAFLAGAIGGVAYLAKTYALPFVLAHLAMTFALKAALRRRGRANGPILRPLAVGVAGLLAVSLPWAAVISLHDGAPTIGSTTRHTRAFSPLAFDKPLPLYAPQLPRPARITTWEDPNEIPYDWPGWSPLAGAQGLRDQLRVTGVLVPRALTILHDLDLMATLLSGLVISAVLLLAGGRALAPGGRAGMSWAVGSALLFVGGYLLIYVEARLLWPVAGLLAAIAIRLVWLATRRLARAGRVARGLFAACLLVSVGYSAAMTIRDWSGPAGKGAWWDWFESSSRQLGVAGPVAANEWHMGLFAAFWNDAAYLGEFKGGDPESIAGQLRPFAPGSVIVINDADLARRLAASPLFQSAGERLASNGWSVHSFRLLPGDARGTRGQDCPLAPASMPRKTQDILAGLPDDGA